MHGDSDQGNPSGFFPDSPDQMDSIPAILRELHKDLPLAGDPVNDLLSLPDDFLRYLVFLVRNIPVAPPRRSRDEWQAFHSLLPPHWIYPLIASHLRSWPEECQPPQEIREYLERISLTSTARTLLAGQQIQAVTRAMKEANVPIILLKGPALARTVYPDPSLRQSSDIDMIVQPHTIPAAEAVLEKLGYTCPAKIFHIYPYADHHEKFFPPKKGLRLQLHWATANEFGLFSDDWLDRAFSRRITVTSGGVSFDTFCPADQLLYLVFHDAFQHRTIRLDWIGDIARVMQQIHSRAEWEELIRQAARNNVRIPLEHCLAAASFWSGAPLPKGAGEFSAWPAPSAGEVRLQKKFSRARLFFISRLILAMQQRPGVYEKMRFVRMFLLPPAPLLWEYRKSSSSLDIPLAHLRRWSRIVTFRL